MPVVDAIREFNASVPFVPYEIHMASGEKFRVPHPDFVSISPKGSWVIVYDAKDRLHHLNVILIEKAVAAGGARKHKRRAA